MKNREDIIGKKFGMITVISIEKSKKNNDNHLMVNGLCDCGKKVFTRLTLLLNNKTKSCGCLAINKTIKRCTKHGYYGSRLYKIWNGMLSRTKYKSKKDKKRYWGRGIYICKDWEDFNSFKEWSLNNGYKDNLSIDRINNDDGYKPSNCRWATIQQQSENKSTTKLYKYKNSFVTIRYLSDISGINKSCLRKRLEKMSVEDALSKPLMKKYCILYKNKKYNLNELCALLNKPYKSTHLRIKKGQKIEKLLDGALIIDKQEK
jgi:hypothetical protein